MSDESQAKPKPVPSQEDAGRLNDDKENPTTKGSGAMPTDPPVGDADPGVG